MLLFAVEYGNLRPNVWHFLIINDLVWNSQKLTEDEKHPKEVSDYNSFNGITKMMPVVQTDECTMIIPHLRNSGWIHTITHKSIGDKYL